MDVAELVPLELRDVTTELDMVLEAELDNDIVAVLDALLDTVELKDPVFDVEIE